MGGKAQDPAAGCTDTIPTTSLLSGWVAWDLNGNGDGNSGFTAGDPVGTVSPITGSTHDNDFTAAGSARPTYQTACSGSVAHCLRFDGTDDALDTGDAAGLLADYKACNASGLACSAYMLVRGLTADPGANEYLFGNNPIGASPTPGVVCYSDDGAPENESINCRGRVATTDTTIATANDVWDWSDWNIVRLSFEDEAAGDDYTIRVNGSEAQTAEPAGAADSSNPSYGFTIGERPDNPGAANSNMDVGAFLLYSDNHDATEEDAVEAGIGCQASGAASVLTFPVDL